MQSNGEGELAEGRVDRMRFWSPLSTHWREGEGVRARARGSTLDAAARNGSKLAGVELGPHGIRVNVISPGAIATSMFEQQILDE